MLRPRAFPWASSNLSNPRGLPKLKEISEFHTQEARSLALSERRPSTPTFFIDAKDSPDTFAKRPSRQRAGRFTASTKSQFYTWPTAPERLSHSSSIINPSRPRSDLSASVPDAIERPVLGGGPAFASRKPVAPRLAFAT